MAGRIYVWPEGDKKYNAERDIFSFDIIGVCQLAPVRERKVPGMEGVVIK